MIRRERGDAEVVPSASIPPLPRAEPGPTSMPANSHGVAVVVSTPRAAVLAHVVVEEPHADECRLRPTEVPSLPDPRHHLAAASDLRVEVVRGQEHQVAAEIAEP